jgi:NAD+ kinase
MTDADSRGRRRVLLVAHTGRPAARDAALEVIDLLHAAGIVVDVLASEKADLADQSDLVDLVDPDTVDGAWELVLVLGGDGTLLRGADLARPSGAPLLGVNLGHVGFLAEAEPEEIAATVDAVVHRRYTIEERMTLDVTVHDRGEITVTDWALNEATIEKHARERMLEIVVEIDGHPLSRWGCDGVVCATPTGSTAYAFSAGGPVVWPEVEAMLVVPISAHALFARPLVVSPASTVAFELLPGTPPGVLWCDGRRMHDISPGARIEVRRGTHRVRLARMHALPFTDRLVAKFDLPVHGWRGRSSASGRS